MNLFSVLIKLQNILTDMKEGEVISKINISLDKIKKRIEDLDTIFPELSSMKNMFTQIDLEKVQENQKINDESIEKTCFEDLEREISENGSHFFGGFNPLLKTRCLYLNEDEKRTFEIFKEKGKIELINHLEQILFGFGGGLGYESPPEISVISYGFGDLNEDVINPKRGIFCKLGISFKNWNHHLLSDSDIDGETQRNKVMKLVSNLMDKVMDVAYEKFSIRAIFSDVDLTSTQGSMRSIFYGKFLGKKIARETEVEKLNLSKTRTSFRSIICLHLLSNLRELYLDYCVSLQKAGKDVFSYLLLKDPISKLEILSVVGITKTMSEKWLKDVDLMCPKLRIVYYTKHQNSKAIGWRDIVMLQSVRQPVLLPCGHVGDREPVLAMKYCPLDRTYVDEDNILPMNPAITQLRLENNGWVSTIVDIKRKQLDSKLLYHPSCGNFYNIESINSIYNLGIIHLDRDSIALLSGTLCIACEKDMKNVRICYPLESENCNDKLFENLETVGSYLIDD